MDPPDHLLCSSGRTRASTTSRVPAARDDPASAFRCSQRDPSKTVFALLLALDDEHSRARDAPARAGIGCVIYRSFLRPILRRLYYAWHRQRERAARARFGNAKRGLGPVPALRPTKAEMHMLCGRAHVEMGLWSAWSLLRTAPDVELYVHSDGSLDDGLPAEWRRLLPDTILVSRSAADERFRESIGSRFPRLAEWRGSFVLAGRLFDMHLFGEHDVVMHMDTDVLFFTRPNELLEHGSRSDLGMAWCVDVLESYYPPRESAKAVFGAVNLPPKVNAGLIALPRLGDEWWERIDRYVARQQSREFPGYTWHAEQTMFAAIAGQIGGRALPPTYGVASRLPEKDLVCQHYAPHSVFRHRFFATGVPALLAAERNRGRRSQREPG
jgi:hypothetical protein